MAESRFFHKIKIGNDARNKLKDFLQNDAAFPNELCQEIKEKITDNFRAIIIELDSDGQRFDFAEIHRLGIHLASFFGELLVQNEQGDKVITVFDRDPTGSIEQGARYHQTREGGSIHTDNVNIPDPWDFLFFSCIAPAPIGGENILVDGLQIYGKLKESFQEVLTILERPFIWEMRGVAESLYQAPIITYNESGEPLFRHLRAYMESAHKKAGKPLNKEQLHAVDVLDALTNSSKYQLRYRMKKGDILLTKDAQVLHGRTCFADALEAVSFDDYEQGKGMVLKRTMERLWVRQ